MTEFVFFWGGQATVPVSKSCMSQWYACTFFDGSRTYANAEQYMMAAKARLFGDSETLEKIMQVSDPMIIKALGREVKNYDDPIWDQVRFDVVVEGNLLKFSQNPELHDYLLSTGDKIIVEASPYDKIWGIGLRESHPDARNINKWPGLNLLGLALMDVREMLFNPVYKV